MTRLIGTRARRAAAALGLAGLIAVLPPPSLLRAADPVEARQRLMVSVVRATRIPREMAQGKTEIDAAAVRAAMLPVIEAAAVLPGLFPDSSSGMKSGALPAVWREPEAFRAGFTALEQAAVQLVFAAEQGGDAFAFAFDAYAATCDSCHARYRAAE
ncbi:c-type cytochrome [Methylobrevis albus]|uniref:Cytochrome c n=1 Tax=Methylobrevis albus TaxID=2793297 RepID=A0A931I029_9HYPH|nr:cytochrome c [Methylobrevis albus]MBH0237887.1 cytochrome c [Methylobrevis albus]